MDPEQDRFALAGLNAVKWWQLWHDSPGARG
jgi:hypothetical protein